MPDRQPAGDAVPRLARRSRSLFEAGNTPTGTASAGQHIAVSWTGSTFAGGRAVPGYVVKRYDLLGNAQTVGAACAGTVTGTSCTENAVPLGTWKYSVTPAAGSWRGTESGQSAAVAVIL